MYYSSSLSGWVVGQSPFQPFSNGLQPKTWVERPSKTNGNQGKNKKAKALPTENGWALKGLIKP